jgi:hypothetical protein
LALLIAVNLVLPNRVLAIVIPVEFLGAVACLVAAGFLYYRPRYWLRSCVVLVAATVAILIAAWSMVDLWDAGARSKGFSDYADKHSAHTAGYDEPHAWLAHEAELKAAQDAIDNGAKSEREQANIKNYVYVMGMDAIRAHLRDGASARYQNVYVGRKQNGTLGPALCGQVNAKNGFGGYAGYERFIAVSDGSTALVESDNNPQNSSRPGACIADNGTG